MKIGSVIDHFLRSHAQLFNLNVRTETDVAHRKIDDLDSLKLNIAGNV